MTFSLDEKQTELVSEWMNNQRVENTGAIGGQFTFQFSPTSIGVFVTVIDCVSGEKFDLNNYESF